MGAINQDKIESLASRRPNATFHVPPLPKLSEEMALVGLKEGVRRWDEKVDQWRTTLEREINERLVKSQSVSSGAPG